MRRLSAISGCPCPQLTGVRVGECHGCACDVCVRVGGVGVSGGGLWVSVCVGVWVSGSVSVCVCVCVCVSGAAAAGGGVFACACSNIFFCMMVKGSLNPKP